MKWYNSFQYKPMHGTMIFIWDKVNQEQVLLNAFWDEANWIPSVIFPIWSYVDEEHKPVLIDQPERSSEKTPLYGEALAKSDEKEMRCAEPDGNIGR